MIDMTPYWEVDAEEKGEIETQAAMTAFMMARGLVNRYPELTMLEAVYDMIEYAQKLFEDTYKIGYDYGRGIALSKLAKDYVDGKVSEHE